MPPISIVGLTPGHSLGDVARAILECICHAVTGNLEALEASLGHRGGRIVFTGGTSRSPFAAQMLADVLGRPVSVADRCEASAVAGAALVTGDQVLGASRHTMYAARSLSLTTLTSAYGDRYRELFTRLQEALG